MKSGQLLEEVGLRDFIYSCMKSGQLLNTWYIISQL